MRANSPADALGPPSELEYHFKIGDKVKVSIRKCDRGYYLKQYLKPLRVSLKSLRKQGYMSGRFLGPGTKDSIRQELDFMATADSIEIVGITPLYGQPVGHIVNQCYLGGVPGAASGVSFHYHLLFRKRVVSDRDRSLVYILRNPLSACSLKLA